jgi:uncharacterized protein with PQ loop repeat
MFEIFKQRETELVKIYRYRLLFLVLTLLMIVGYLTIQIHDIINETPPIRLWYDESDSLPAPGYFIFTLSS